METELTPKAVLKISPFVHLLTKGTKHCLVHSLTFRKAYGGEILRLLHDKLSAATCVCDVVEDLGQRYPPQLVGDVIRDLADKGILVEDNRGDLSTYVQLFEKGMQLYAIQHMYFIPTTACNFRCKYCFVEDEGKDLQPEYMSEQTARRGLEVFAKLSENANTITMTFYGGEPLLHAKVLFYAMRYVRNLEQRGMFKKRVSMSLLTNGALVDDETVRAVLETETKVSVSIDGPGEIHDRVRQYTGGRGSYQAALAGYRKLQDAGAAPGISCTVTQCNVDDLEQIAWFIVRELKPSGMGFNILLPLRGSENPAAVAHDYASSKLISAFDILRRHGIYEDRVMRRVRPYTEMKVHLKDCMGVGGQIVLDPHGRIGPCQAYLGMPEYFPLDVNVLHDQRDTLTSDEIYANPLFDEWRHRFPFNMKECSRCFAIAICGGGCPYASEVNHGSIWQIDERVCSQAKQIMEWMIWDTCEQWESESRVSSHPARQERQQRRKPVPRASSRRKKDISF